MVFVRRNKRTKKFRVVIEYDPSEPTPYKYGVYVPSLPPCYSEGRTRAEALENIREVLSLYLDAQKELAKRRRIEVVSVKV